MGSGRARRPVALITARMFGRTNDVAARRLEEAGYRLRFPADRNRPTPESEVKSLLDDVAVVIAGVERWTDELMSAAPGLELICRFGVGFDSIDQDAAIRHGVLVAITPSTNHTAVAEHTLALMLAVMRRVASQDAMVKRGRWVPEQGPELRERTLGVVGLGRIGREVTDLALAFGMKVIACEVAPDPAFVADRPITVVDLDALLPLADVVSLHVPLVPETRWLINAQALARMRLGAYLVNTSRGGLIDEGALYRFLTSGHLAGAGLDVSDPEPPSDWRLAQLPQVVMTPHTAGLSTDAILRMEASSVDTILAVQRGERPPNILNPGVRVRS